VLRFTHVESFFVGSSNPLFSFSWDFMKDNIGLGGG
jgi:hypothetical protein